MFDHDILNNASSDQWNYLWEAKENYNTKGSELKEQFSMVPKITIVEE